jgi:hypothetical protein
VKNELTRIQGLTDPRHPFMAPAQAAVLLGVKHKVAILALQLDLIHGLIGWAQQLVGIHLVGLRIEGDNPKRVACAACHFN